RFLRHSSLVTRAPAFVPATLAALPPTRAAPARACSGFVISHSLIECVRALDGPASVVNPEPDRRFLDRSGWPGPFFSGCPISFDRLERRTQFFRRASKRGEKNRDAFGFCFSRDRSAIVDPRRG